MTKLEKLYGMIASTKELGIKIGDDVYRQTAEMEESIIKAEIVSVIRDTIAFGRLCTIHTIDLRRIYSCTKKGKHYRYSQNTLS